MPRTTARPRTAAAAIKRHWLGIAVLTIVCHRRSGLIRIPAQREVRSHGDGSHPTADGQRLLHEHRDKHGRFGRGAADRGRSRFVKTGGNSLATMQSTRGLQPALPTLRPRPAPAPTDPDHLHRQQCSGCATRRQCLRRRVSAVPYGPSDQASTPRCGLLTSSQASCNSAHRRESCSSGQERAQQRAVQGRPAGEPIGSVRPRDRQSEIHVDSTGLLPRPPSRPPAARGGWPS